MMTTTPMMTTTTMGTSAAVPAATPSAVLAANPLRRSRLVVHRRPPELPQRTFHLVDMENLVGGAVTAAAVAGAWAEYVAAVGVREGDHVTVAVARRHAATAFFALPAGIRRLVGSDAPDGADLALLEAVDVELVAARFDRVVIGSGDHAFTPLAADLFARGAPVIDVVGKGAPARDLSTVCGRPVRLPVRWTGVRELREVV